MAGRRNFLRTLCLPLGLVVGRFSPSAKLVPLKVPSPNIGGDLGTPSATWAMSGITFTLPDKTEMSVGDIQKALLAIAQNHGVKDACLKAAGYREE